MLEVVVFDTSVLISAFLTPGGKSSRCVSLGRERKIQSITCREILQEFEEKLIRKFYNSAECATKVISEIESFSRIVTISGNLHIVQTDPDDDKVIECAVVGEATHIVSGDRKDLLSLKSYQGIEIVSAAEFLEVVSKG